MQTRKIRKGDIVEACCSALVSEGLGLSHIALSDDSYKPLTGFIWGVLPGERFLAEVRKSKSGYFHAVLLPASVENFVPAFTKKKKNGHKNHPKDNKDKNDQKPAPFSELNELSGEWPSEWIGKTEGEGSPRFAHQQFALFEVSPDRIDPPCENFTLCGGCKLLHLPYEKTLDYKNEWLKTQLQRAGVPEIPETKIHSSPRTTFYRNHVQVHINKWKERGFYAPYSYRTQPFPQEGCLLFDQALMDANFPRELELERCVRSRIDSNAKKAGVWSLHSPEDKKARFEYMVEYPPGSSTKVNFENPGFFQTNLSALPLWLDSIERAVQDCAGKLGKQKQDRLRILELFSGFGFITSLLSYRFEGELEVFGIDLISPKSVSSVHIENNKHGIPPVRQSFLQNYRRHDLTALEDDLPQLGAEIAAFHPDLILMNPPRSGFQPAQMENLFQAMQKPLDENSKRENGELSRLPIVYSSCNAATMARDIQRLASAGYRVEKLELFDFFPWTSHYEVLGVLD